MVDCVWDLISNMGPSEYDAGGSDDQSALILPTNMRIGGYDFFILDEYNKVSLES
jgi:hypothetical protein